MTRELCSSTTEGEAEICRLAASRKESYRLVQRAQIIMRHVGRFQLIMIPPLQSIYNFRYTTSDKLR